jgi:hypothetical protein
MAEVLKPGDHEVNLEPNELPQEKLLIGPETIPAEGAAGGQ